MLLSSRVNTTLHPHCYICRGITINNNHNTKLNNDYQTIINNNHSTIINNNNHSTTINNNNHSTTINNNHKTIIIGSQYLVKNLEVQIVRRLQLFRKAIL